MAILTAFNAQATALPAPLTRIRSRPVVQLASKIPSLASTITRVLPASAYPAPHSASLVVVTPAQLAKTDTTLTAQRLPNVPNAHFPIVKHALAPPALSALMATTTMALLPHQLASLAPRVAPAICRLKPAKLAFQLLQVHPTTALIPHQRVSLATPIAPRRMIVLQENAVNAYRDTLLIPPLANAIRAIPTVIQRLARAQSQQHK